MTYRTWDHCITFFGIEADWGVSTMPPVHFLYQ
jgi:hypothetical protein